LSLQDGFTKIDRFDWNAYNEGTYLVSQVEAYKKLYGYYPELVYNTFLVAEKAIKYFFNCIFLKNAITFNRC
jgi:hypothetical protein